MENIIKFLTEDVKTSKFDKSDIKGVFNYLKSLGFEEDEVIDACNPLWMKLHKLKRGDEVIHVWVYCKVRTQDETSIESVTNSHNVSLITKRGKKLIIDKIN